MQWEDQRYAHANGIDREAALTHGNSGPTDTDGKPTLGENDFGAIPERDDRTQVGGKTKILHFGDATIDKKGGAPIDKNGDATIDKNRFDEIPEDGGEISGKFIPDMEYREHHAPSMKRVGKDGVPLEKEIFDAQGNPKIDAIENTLGTDAHEKNCRTELVERPDAKIDSDNTPENKQRHDFSQENETLPEKTRKIIVIPVCYKSEAPAQELSKVNGDKKEKELQVQHESQRSNYPIGSIYQSHDQESQERYRPEGQVVDKNERQKMEKPQTSKNQDRETGSLSEPSSLQSGQKQNGINSVSAHKNTQLNVDQTEAKEPLTLLDTNKNYGLQEYIENKETNINTNVFVDHKL